MDRLHATRIAGVIAALLGIGPLSWAAGQTSARCMIFQIPGVTLRVSGVEALRAPDRSVRAASPQLLGAIVEVTTESQFAITPQWLERTLRERTATMLPQAASMPDCPFVVEGVQVRVTSTSRSSTFRVEIRAPTPSAGSNVLRRTQASFPAGG